MSKKDKKNINRNAFINIPNDDAEFDNEGTINLFNIERKKAKTNKEEKTKTEEMPIDIIASKPKEAKAKTKKSNKKVDYQEKKAEIVEKKEDEKTQVKYKYSTTKHIKRNISRRKKLFKRDKKTDLIVMMIYGVAGFIICSLLITRYSYICKIDAEIRDMSTEIKGIEAQIEERALELSILDDISAIEKVAKSELKMYYPNANQIHYIDMSKNK